MRKKGLPKVRMGLEFSEEFLVQFGVNHESELSPLHLAITLNVVTDYVTEAYGSCQNIYFGLLCLFSAPPSTRIQINHYIFKMKHLYSGKHFVFVVRK